MIYRSACVVMFVGFSFVVVPAASRRAVGDDATGAVVPRESAATYDVALVDTSQPDRQRLAFTDPSAVDEDFPFQGEYFGQAACWNGVSGYWGLQVIALGDGQFRGVLMPGGLPGAGWSGTERWVMEGQRTGDQLELEGSGYRAQVEPAAASITTLQGTPMARLPKIHRISPTLGAAPPCGAVVLFDGTSTEWWQNGRIVEDGLLDVGAITSFPVSDFRLHLEFRLPYMPYARGQRRGNSGVYIQQRYEVQILDSFGLEGVENECAAIYKRKRPDTNMCLPPLSWQTYDISFRSARWDSSGRKVANAVITVWHNGEPVHACYEIPNKTGAGKEESPDPRPVLLQNHGNPVRFRNIWIELCAPQATRQTVPMACLPVLRRGWSHRSRIIRSW